MTENSIAGFTIEMKCGWGVAEQVKQEVVR